MEGSLQMAIIIIYILSSQKQCRVCHSSACLLGLQPVGLPTNESLPDSYILNMSVNNPSF